MIVLPIYLSIEKKVTRLGERNGPFVNKSERMRDPRVLTGTICHRFYQSVVLLRTVALRLI